MGRAQVTLALFMVAGQGADLLTWAQMDQQRELNPAVVWLGPWALGAKAALMVLLLVAASVASRRVGAALMLAGGLVGALGALTNL